MINQALNYYGYLNIEDFSKSVGLSTPDAEQLLKEMYEEDTAPEA